MPKTFRMPQWILNLNCNYMHILAGNRNTLFFLKNVLANSYQSIKKLLNYVEKSINNPRRKCRKWWTLKFLCLFLSQCMKCKISRRFEYSGSKSTLFAQLQIKELEKCFSWKNWVKFHSCQSVPTRKHKKFSSGNSLFHHFCLSWHLTIRTTYCTLCGRLTNCGSPSNSAGKKTLSKKKLRSINSDFSLFSVTLLIATHFYDEKTNWRTMKRIHCENLSL